jgi:hypothetical protein
MQSQSLILLAEVLHDELQTEAARFQIVNQACAGRPTTVEVVASTLRRVRVALANATVRLHMPGTLTGAGADASAAIPGVGTDEVLWRTGVCERLPHRGWIGTLSRGSGSPPGQ